MEWHITYDPEPSYAPLAVVEADEPLEALDKYVTAQGYAAYSALPEDERSEYLLVNDKSGIVEGAVLENYTIYALPVGA